MKTDEEWQVTLTPEQYRVLRGGGLNRRSAIRMPSTSPRAYRCAACGAELFRSDAKFDSGTGWPSFTEPSVAEAGAAEPGPTTRTA